MKEKQKKNKGITLIALVITIIVLLILAGVTIVTLTGDNGLLQKAQTAKEENEEAKKLELIKLAVSAAQITGKGKLTTKNLESELRNNFEDKHIYVREFPSGWRYDKYKIYNDGRVEENIYQYIEYIESTGTQWIDTKYIPKMNTELILELSFSGDFYTNHNGNTNIFATQNKDGMYNFSLNFGGNYNQKNQLYAWVNKGNSYGGTICAFGINDNIKNNKNIIKMKSGNIIYGTVSKELDEKTQDNDNSLLLFASANKTPISCYNMKVYSLKFYEGEILRRNYIPCQNSQTEQIGLYEEIEGKFYTNANTAADAVDFIAGPEV